MSADLVAVTAATGQLGGRVARRLAARGVRQRLVVRDPSRAPQLSDTETVEATYQDGTALREALRGVDTLLLVSASETADRVAVHRNAVDAAVDAGVQRIVYTSFLGAAEDCTFTFGRHHWHTEQHIRHRGLPATFLRDSLYLDVLPFFVGADGVIRGPAGDGRVAAVARDDVADVAVEALLDPAHAGQTYELTGPEALSMGELAARLTRLTGRQIAYHNESLEEAYASRASYGAPGWEVEGWVTSYAAIAAGELDVRTDDVERVTGHPPVGLDELVTRDPSLVRHLRVGGAAD